MDLKRYFQYSPELELTAAQIGINKWDWEKAPNEEQTHAKRIMELNRFDILPIDKNNQITHYFKTETWGDFSKITLKQITSEDKIYYRTSFLDLIKKMITEDKYFYFLSNSSEVLGLVSMNNLNCLAVYNFIYQITASLEQMVSNFLKNELKEQQVLEWLEQTSDQQAKKVVESYRKLENKNKENSIFEFMFFPTLGTLLNKASETINKSKPELLNYRKKFCAGELYWEIRNTVSHPVKPLFKDKNSVRKVNQLISDYNEIRGLLV